MNNPYKVLGVNENATQEEIRAAYLQLVKKIPSGPVYRSGSKSRGQ